MSGLVALLGSIDPLPMLPPSPAGVPSAPSAVPAALAQVDTRIIPLPIDRARDVNAAVPFAKGPVVAARQFTFKGGADQRELALSCLASAGWYEAGDDRAGQEAVMQVVLNRVRHPAYPKSVCGVVFQGAERRTGCQFTFTCDGSMRRAPPAAGWARARAVADKALSGAVHAGVGTATHYHTDWVVPYWSATLDKIARVETHLFFRWRGAWGQIAAFGGRYAGPEPVDARILALADASKLPRGLIEQAATVGPSEDPAATMAQTLGRALRGNRLRLADPDADVYVLDLDPKATPASYGGVAAAICRDKPLCRVFGWLGERMAPASLPMPVSAMRSAAFLYRKSRAGEEPMWNCRRFSDATALRCIPGTEAPAPAVAGSEPPRTTTAEAREPWPIL